MPQSPFDKRNKPGYLSIIRNFLSGNHPSSTQDISDGDLPVVGDVYHGSPEDRDRLQPQLGDRSRYASTIEEMQGGKTRGGTFAATLGNVHQYGPGSSPTPAYMMRSESPAPATSGDFISPTVNTGFPSDSSDSVVEPLSRASSLRASSQSEEASNISGTHLTPRFLATARDNINARRPTAPPNSQSPQVGELRAARRLSAESGQLNPLPGVPETLTAALGDEADTDSSACVRSLWIGAEHALMHAKSQISAISKVLRRRNIQETEYIVQAGFDEKLITSGIGYLEQIHVFVSAKLDAAAIPKLLPELGRVLSPFSSILFTESSSHLIPVFKDNGDIYEFNWLVLDTASKFSDNGSTASMPLTVLSLSNASSTASPSGLSPSQPAGSNQNHDKGKKRDRGDDDKKSDKDRKDSPGDPSTDPPSGSMPEFEGVDPRKVVEFEITSKVYRSTGDTDTIFQTLRMVGAFTIETLPLGKPGRLGGQHPERHLGFLRLGFRTLQPVEEVPYEQVHIGIAVDSCVGPGQAAVIKALHPKQTRAFDLEEKTTSTTIIGSSTTKGMTAELSAKPHLSAKYERLANRGINAASERKKHNSRIMEFDGDGVIRWGFLVEDAHEQGAGCDMDVGILPAVEFNFRREPKPEIPLIPTNMDVVISSFWSNIRPESASGPQHTGWIQRVLQLLRFKSSTSASAISYSNLLQVVAFKMEPDTLPNDYLYHSDASMRVQSDDTGPHPGPQATEVQAPVQVKLELVPPGLESSIHSTPMVFQVKDRDPLKLHYTVNIPGIEKLRLSKKCLEGWSKPSSSTDAE